jgi:hypothetical protein
VLTSYPGASQLASALAAADLSANGATFDGLLTFAVKSGSGAYVQSLANGTRARARRSPRRRRQHHRDRDGVQYFWDNYRLSPTDIWVAARSRSTSRRR